MDRAVKKQTVTDQGSVRLTMTVLNGPHRDPDGAAGRDVVAGLTATPKTLPSRYFYDDAGSALFDRICHLPEYYPTRTEESILRRTAVEIAALSGPCALVELGSGTARKTRLLIEAFLSGGRSLSYRPVDVSGGVVEASAARLLADYPGLEVHGLVGTYEQAFERLAWEAGPREPLLILFLGSTIGNFTPAETEAFLGRVRQALRPGDTFLIGIDLRKDVQVIEAAYNDSQGVTAAFNRNMLSHLNRLFQGDFAPERFDHVAFYNGQAHQIEMHLRSQGRQRARLEALGLDVALEPGETIWTEISRKCDREEFAALLGTRGFEPVRAWADERNWFALLLARAV